MRYVPSISSATPSPITRQVKGLVAAHAVRPVFPPEQSAPAVEQPAVTRQVQQQVERQQYRAVPFEERRKICRRVSHQPVLVELRSGIERRHHNLRDGDIVDHIDEEA